MLVLPGIAAQLSLVVKIMMQLRVPQMQLRLVRNLHEARVIL